MNLLRHPAFGVGIVLLVLGVGNWSVAASKLAEYRHFDKSVANQGTLGNFEDFTELDARTNAELLRPLHRGIEPSVIANTKGDFYKVVQTGGQLFAFAGFGLILIASFAVWRGMRGPSLAVSPH
jgi:hypothetical protein